MKLNFHLLRQKLFATVLLTTLVALLVSLSAMIAYDLRLYHTNLIAGTSMQSQLMGSMTAAALVFDDERLAKENLSLLHIRPTVRAAAIYNSKGHLFATYIRSGQEGNFPPMPTSETTHIDGTNLIIFTPIINDGVNVGTVYMRTDYELKKRMRDYFGMAGIVTVCAMLIAFLITARLARVLTDPIAAIAEVAREVVSQRNYSRRAEKTSTDEVGTLVDSFNDMLSEIERRTTELEVSNAEIVREVEQRWQAQQEVMRLNTELEQRVSERTAQLEASNHELALAKATADNANQAKSAFLSSMSHELRTPLNAILGFAQLSDSASIPSTPAQKKVFNGHILKAGKHLLTLINEVLDLAKIESGTMALSIEPVALSEIMQESQVMMEPMGNQRGIRLILPAQTDLHVMADRTRIKQIFLNLLSNAVKYNREQGLVMVECSTTENGNVRISIQDTGVGLSQEQVASLFQPFNRLGQEAGTEEGSGIGLVVTKRLVELMGGTIGMSSQVGAGSLFWIELKAAKPIGPIVKNENVREIQPVQTGQREDAISTLLYVEDNPANLKLIEEIVGFRDGLKMLSAPDANLGIALARVHLPQVILMDINLPGMSGYEARRILSADQRTSHIPIIALTANAMPRDIAHGLESGFFRYLTKPIDIDEFSEAIESALRLAKPDAGTGTAR